MNSAPPPAAPARERDPAGGDSGEHETLRRLRRAMKDAGCDALVALSQDNVTYASGFLVPSHATNRFRRTIVILAGDTFAAQIVVNVEELQARSRSRFRDIRSYNQFTENPADTLADALAEAGVAGGRIAIELDFLPAQDYIRLVKRLPRAEFEGCAELFFRTRMIKSEEEIATLRRVGTLSERVIKDVLGGVRVGMTEIDVSRRLVDGMIAGGSSNFKYRVGSGANSSITNCGTTSKKIEPGDTIRIEVLGDIDNYRSNVTRTAVAGRPDERQARTWATLMRARDECGKLLRPGTAVAEVWRTYLRICREGGIEPTLKFLGHGIGQTIHEEPYLTETKDIVFEPNITFTMEPLYMIPGEMGFHVEDMYVITKNGCDAITGRICPNDELIAVG
ncbi:MAG: aminopeptidase P family protein [Burkholderiales bacterium]|nr:aminopeptidase P family protein [Burkholderiales bacterium]